MALLLPILLLAAATSPYDIVIRNGHIVECNQEACDYLGYRRDELLTMMVPG